MKCAIVYSSGAHETVNKWIEHHFSIGFDKIYLLDANKEIKYNVKNCIVLDAANLKQDEAYSRVVSELNNDDMFMFLDDDEYLSCIPEINAPVQIYWNMIGSTNILNTDNQDTFISTPHQISKCCYLYKFLEKSIRFYFPFKTIGYKNMCLKKTGIPYIHNPFSVAPTLDIDMKLGHIDHYYCLSFEDYCNKINRGSQSQFYRNIFRYLVINPSMYKNFQYTEDKLLVGKPRSGFIHYDWFDKSCKYTMELGLKRYKTVYFDSNYENMSKLFLADNYVCIN